MSSSYYDISAADRIDLEEIFGEIFGKVEILEEIVEEAIDDIRELIGCEGDKLRRDEIVDTVVDELRECIGGAFLFELVSALGAAGWEFVSPARVRVLRERLRIYNRVTESLSRGKRSGKTRRPRVKRLKE